MGKTTAAYVYYKILVPVATVDVHEQPSVGVGDVGNVHPPPRFALYPATPVLLILFIVTLSFSSDPTMLLLS